MLFVFCASPIIVSDLQVQPVTYTCDSSVSRLLEERAPARRGQVITEWRQCGQFLTLLWILGRASHVPASVQRSPRVPWKPWVFCLDLERLKWDFVLDWECLEWVFYFGLGSPVNSSAEPVCINPPNGALFVVESTFCLKNKTAGFSSAFWSSSFAHGALQMH